MRSPANANANTNANATANAPANGIGIGGAAAAALDGTLVLGFAVIGRASHAEQITVPGVLETAWPFLVGLAVGWVLFRAWRDPRGVVVPGLAIAASAIGVGLVLRALLGDGVPPDFAVVTTIVLGGVLLGWRGVVALVRRSLRRRR